MNYITYFTDGSILSSGTCVDITLIPLAAGEAALQVQSLDNLDQQYVFGVVLTMRPPCPVSAQVNGRVITFSGLPVNSTGQITGDATMSINNTDPSGSNVLTFPNAGTYTITVGCFPALDYTETFTLP